MSFGPELPSLMRPIQMERQARTETAARHVAPMRRKIPSIPSAVIGGDLRARRKSSRSNETPARIKPPRIRGLVSQKRILMLHSYGQVFDCPLSGNMTKPFLYLTISVKHHTARTRRPET